MTHEAERHHIFHRLDALLGNPKRAKELVWLMDFHSETLVLEVLRQYSKRDLTKGLTANGSSDKLCA
jgi:hypothetical protein